MSNSRRAAGRRLAGVAVLLLAAGCARPANTSAVLEVAERTNGYVTLASDGAKVGAVWAAAGPTGRDIYFSVSPDGGRQFGRPVRVSDGTGRASASGEQPPRVVMHASVIDVVWVTKREGIASIATAESQDGGATFSVPRIITPSGVSGARGWESAALGDDGSVHVAWLDGRQADAGEAAVDTVMPAATPPASEHHHHHDLAPRQDIFHSTWAGEARPLETRVASNVCFCCKTAILTRGHDVYVAWRHLFDGGVRDIAIAHSSDEGRTFGAPVRVSADNWKLDACPDDGPSMVFDSQGTLHVVWPTLVHDSDHDRIAIFHANSVDGGATFTPRERVDGARKTNPSHPRVAAGPHGTVAIVWDELIDGRRQVSARLWGTTDKAIRILSRATASSYPFITSSGSQYVVAWSEDAASGSRVVLTSFH
jgi:hypothetical protein